MRAQTTVGLPFFVLVVSMAAIAANPVQAQTAENVLLVVNDANPASVRIGEYYAQKRGVSPDDIVHLKFESKDEIAAADFHDLIQAPIARVLAQRNAHDRILYIVLTKGIPLRVAGTPGRKGTQASVDSELALLYRRMTGAPVSPGGPIPNPYFLGDTPIAQAKAFSHAAHDVFLVTRLDGFTVEDVIGMIDRGTAPVAGGRFLLDEKASWKEKGNEWLEAAAGWLTANGFSDRVTLETTSRVLSDEPDVMGYYSWGSTDPDLTRRHLGFKFMPGALAAMFVSTDARTLNEPPSSWKYGTWQDPKTFFVGSPQSLVGDLIRDGITGVAGQAAEPYLDGAVRPDILFPAYASGFNLAESFYLATPYLSWQTVVVGDPLCVPFHRTQSLSATDIDKGIDKEMGLPTLFARRALRAASDSVPDTSLALLKVKAEACLAREDRAGARQAYEQLTAADARVTSAQLALASLYDQSGEYDKGIERYRRVLVDDPNNVGALNNLAYSLATRKNQPKEALPLAERAYALASGDANVADTLGWTYHLTGDDKKAAPLLAQAAGLLPTSAEIQLHLAVVYGTAGMLDQAAKRLAKALELDPTLEKREEVIALRAKVVASSKK